MKGWQIAVSGKLDFETRRKIRRLLQPVFSVHVPGKCLFCGMLTTWTINNKSVCPNCHVKYGFVKKDRIPDPCEVCGLQGEWCTEGKPIHSLCYIHRDEWFHWERPELKYIDHKKEPERWDQVWEEGWSKFISCMKEKNK